MQTPTIEVLSASGEGLRIDFEWRGDRFQHTIALTNASGEWQTLLESVEGTAADDWPSSPPLQSLSVETLPCGERAALLLGMAGRSHWSASVESRPAEAQLIFDVACRHPTQAGWLGSRYRWLADDAARRSIGLAASPGQISGDGTFLVIEPASRTQRAATSRWRFTVSLAPSQPA